MCKLRIASDKNIALALYNERCKKGWSTKDLAERLGVTYGTVLNREKTGCHDLVSLRKYAEVFGITLEDILLSDPRKEMLASLNLKRDALLRKRKELDAQIDAVEMQILEYEEED